MSNVPALAPIEAIPHRPEADSFDFGKSWLLVKQACHGHKLLIAATAAVTVALLVLYVLLWPPIFSAEVQLVAESDKDSTRAGFYSNWAVFRRDNLPDEVQMFTAAPVLEEVVKKMHLTYDDVYHPFLSQAAYLWQESWLGRTYRKGKEWLFPPKMSPYGPTPEEAQLGRLLQDFKAGVQLEPLAETNTGKLIVKGPSPRVAEIANTIVSVYFEQRRNRHVQEAEDAYQALDAELQKAQAELSSLEERQQQYYSENGMLLMFEKDKIDIGRWEALNATIADLKTAIAGNEQTLAALNTLLAKEQKDVVATRTLQANPVQDSMQDKLAQLQLTRKQTLIHFKVGSPEIQELDSQIANVRDQLAHEPQSSVRQTTMALSSSYETLRGRKMQLESELAGQRASLAVRLDSANKYRTMVDLIPAKMKIVHEFDREHGALEKKYTELRDKLMIAVVSRATAQLAPASIRTVQGASAPGEARWPQTKLLMLIGAILGVIAGIMLALLIDLIHGRVNRHRLSGGDWDLSVYAIVGRDRMFAAQLFPPPPAIDGPIDGGSGRSGAIVGGDRSPVPSVYPPPVDEMADSGPGRGEVRLVGFQF